VLSVGRIAARFKKINPHLSARIFPTDNDALVPDFIDDN